MLFHIIHIIVCMAILADCRNKYLTKGYLFSISQYFFMSKDLRLCLLRQHIHQHWKDAEGDHHGPCTKMARKFLTRPYLVRFLAIQLFLRWLTPRKWWGLERSLQRPIWGLFPRPLHQTESLLSVLRASPQLPQSHYHC